MSSAGTSGTSNAETGANLNGTPLGMENVGGETIETVEVIEVVETVNPYEYSAEGGAGGLGGFRWWYVPAIALPIVAGGAIFWYAKNGKQPFMDARDLLARKGSDFADLLQEQTGQLQGKAGDLKGKSAAAVGAVASAGVLDKIGDTLEDLRDSASDLMDRAKPRERVVASGKRTGAQVIQARRMMALDQAQARSAQARQKLAMKQAQGQAKSKWNDFTDMMGNTGSAVTGWIAAQRIQDRAKSLQGKAADKAGDLKLQKKATVAKTAAKAGASVAAMKTSKAASQAGMKASRAVQKSGKRARASWRRTRAFTFGMLVTAMATYVRLWRQRITEKNTRETAGGRLVRDA